MGIAIIRTLGLLLIATSAATAQAIAQQCGPLCGEPQLFVAWSQFQFGPCLTGYNPYETILSPATVGNLVLDWRDQGDSGVYTGPAVVDGLVYFGSFEYGGVYAVNAATGKPKWSNRCGGLQNSSGSPAVAYGQVYVAGAGAVCAFDAATGRFLWEQEDPFGDTPVAQITVSNGAVYVASYHIGNYHTAHVYALNAATGAVLWKVSGDQWNTTTPAVANGLVYSGCDYGSMCAFDATTGVLVWEYTAPGNISSAAVADGVVYFGSVMLDANNVTPIYLTALNATTGALIWQRPVTAAANATQDDLLSAPAVATGTVYIGSGYPTPSRCHLYAVDAFTGALLWQYEAAGTLDYTSPTVANGVVYFGTWDSYHGDGSIYALDAHMGALLWQYTFADGAYSPPTIENGRLYVGTFNYVYAFHLPGQ